MLDGKHAFENGLPPNGDKVNGAVAPSQWGYVTTQQYLTSSFDNDPNARTNQDVGLDGLSTTEETTKFQSFINSPGVPASERDKIATDPSADNFRYYFNTEYDGLNAKILQRYKDFNGLDGNSPIITGSDLIAQAATTIPDNEDLNADNTLTELEEYYEYDMDLQPGQLRIGREYIVDEITTTNNNSKESVTWYLFRIPVRVPERQEGNIEGFKSIKYMRMLLTGFKDPIVLRMANFRMVGSRWRRYTSNLQEGGLVPNYEETQDDFMVSVVNLEENGYGNDNKPPYVIPPGVVRDRDVTSSVSRQLNEQSAQLCADDIKDGDARAMYKNMSVDLFNYGRIKMYFHGHSEIATDDELRVFLRLGKDLDSNFYEIEIPLKITQTPISGDRERAVWPEENEIDLALDELYRLKADRDRENISMNQFYPIAGREVGRHKIRIFGRPDLTSVQSILIGVRNPRSDDKRSYPVCIWANEMRVTDFNRTPGWAANATLSAKLADFATVTGAVRHTSFGFGGVSSKIFERTREETTGYDVSANVNVDKLLPGNTGIKIPMFVSYEKTTITPLYDPANPDLKLDAALQSFNEEQRINYLKIVRDQTIGRSLNFVNVRKTKVKPDAPTHIWDIENFSFSYSYSDRVRTNFNMQEAFQKQQKGSIAYTYNPKATGIEPFKNSKGLSSPWLKPIKDFNFSLMPSSIGVRLDLNRSFSKNVYRNPDGIGGFITSPANYMKYFTFDRQYNVRWNLSKNLSLEYNSRANAIIDEPDGDLDTEAKKDSVWHNLKRFGRMKNFDQSVTLNYTLPLDKIPATDWLGADYRYQVNYNWKAGPINRPDRIVGSDTIAVDLLDAYDFKNTIQNSRDQNFSGKIDLVRLYNKVKFLKELNTPKKPLSASQRAQQARTQQQQKADTTKVKAPAEIPGLVKGLLRMLMSVRSINGTYSVTEGTILPGFNKTPKFFGMDNDWNAPGWGFVLGSQNPDIRFKAAENGWLVANKEELSIPFSQIRNETINIRANVEPTSDFKILLDLKKEVSNSYQSIFRDTLPGNDISYGDLSPSRSGSYRISTISIKTAFNSSNNDVESSVFKEFESNLLEMKTRLQFANNGETYDTTSQDVPAMI
jgi:cell surface protein SprA